jgi:hypothetical protein
MAFILGVRLVSVNAPHSLLCQVFLFRRRPCQTPEHSGGLNLLRSPSAACLRFSVSPTVRGPAWGSPV